MRARVHRREIIRQQRRRAPRVKVCAGVARVREFWVVDGAPFVRGNAQARAIAKAGAYSDRRRGTEPPGTGIDRVPEPGERVRR